jgi:hypothetical protein
VEPAHEKDAKLVIIMGTSRQRLGDWNVSVSSRSRLVSTPVTSRLRQNAQCLGLGAGRLGSRLSLALRRLVDIPGHAAW